MRVIVAAAAFTMLLGGCANTPPTASPTPMAGWRVIPLNPSTNFPDRIAILVNEQTGDTWTYNAASNEWNPLKRN